MSEFGFPDVGSKLKSIIEFIFIKISNKFDAQNDAEIKKLLCSSFYEY